MVVSNSSENGECAVEHGDILQDGVGNHYEVLIDQTGHAELRRVDDSETDDSG